MVTPSAVHELLAQILFSRDLGPFLYKVCAFALDATGARNAMVAVYNDLLGAMTLRAGIGKDWSPEMLGERISIGVEGQTGITSFVAATGKSYVSDDVSGESYYRQLIEGTRSELASPIFDRYGRVIGVINLESDKIAQFKEHEQEISEMLAMILGMSLDKEASRQREEALLQVGVALDEAKTEKELLKRVAQVIHSVLDVSAYSIFLWDESEQAFVLRDTVGSTKLQPEARYQPGEGCTGWVCQHGEPIRISDPQQEPRWRGKFLEFPLEEIAAFIAVPIVSGGKCMGCMRALRKKPENPYLDNRFTEDDERLLLAIAEQLGTGLQKIRSVKKLVQSERMAAWGELSAKSSHMIGNRVFALKGELNELRYLLNQEKLSKDSLNEVVDNLAAGIDRLDEILHEFRDFVTATRIDYSEGDINEVVMSAAGDLVPKGGNIQLIYEVDHTLQKFDFDFKKIERVVSELVENAMHFVDNGQLVVRTKMASREDLERAGVSGKGMEFVQVEVEDKGPGVAAKSKHQIFTPFHSSRAKGMGLGLSIVKGIIDAHGGTVYEAGEEGKGARFIFLLPVRHGASNES